MTGADIRVSQAIRSKQTGPEDEANMALAISLGRRGLGRCWPNPAVGAVVADPGGRIISCAWTAPGGRPHAEAIALAEAGEAARGATLYVTLEPCSHWGKTPPCADAILKSGIARVVYGLVDPDPRVAGNGLQRLRSHDVTVVPGPLPAEARWLTLGHELRITRERPFVQLKLAVDRNGLVPEGGNGAPVWATSREARALGHMMRAQADAIMVGYGTMLADDPDLTCRLPGLGAASPVRIVLSSQGRLNRDAKMLKNLETAPVWVVVADDLSELPRLRIEQLGASAVAVRRNAQRRLDANALMSALAGRGITRLLVEGGPSLQASLLAEGFADEIVIFQGEGDVRGATIQPFAPLGLASITDSPDYRLHDTRRIGDDRVWVYRKKEYWQI